MASAVRARSSLRNGSGGAAFRETTGIGLSGSWCRRNGYSRAKRRSIREATPDGIPDAVPEFTRQLDAANARADEANKRADATLALADRLGAQLADAAARAERAEQRVEEVLAGQLLMAETYARELVVAQHDAKAARQAADELRQAEAARKGQGRWARLRAAWRGE